MNEENKILEENIKRHISVLVEDMRSDFKVLADGQQLLERKFDLMAEDVDEIKSDIVDMKRDIKELKTDVAVLKTDVAVLKTDVAVLKTDVAQLKSDMTEVKDELKVKAEKNDVQDHETRIVKLENAALAKAA